MWASRYPARACTFRVRRWYSTTNHHRSGRQGGGTGGVRDWFHLLQRRCGGLTPQRRLEARERDPTRTSASAEQCRKVAEGLCIEQLTESVRAAGNLQVISGLFVHH